MIQDNIIRVIVVEESANDAEVILNSLRKARFPIRPKHVEDAEDLQEALNQQEWDLIISVPKVGDFTVGEVCELTAGSNQGIPVIVLCNNISSDCIVSMLSSGVRQIIPADNETCFQIVVKRELENLEHRRKRRHAEHMYRESQRHNKMLLETSRDAIAYVHDGMHIHANPTYLGVFGYKDMEELEALPVLDLVAPDDHADFKAFMREYMGDKKEEDRQIKLRGLRSNNKRFKLKMEVSKAIYEDEKCIQIVIRDESGSKELERKLKEMDNLTGLYNRQHFIQLLEKALSKAMEARVRSVAMYLVLDNFNSIRERVGVGAIDPIIVNIADVLKKHAPEASVARFSESVFTLLLTDKDIKAARNLAETLRKAVEVCVTELPDQSVVTTCSIGIALVLASAANPKNVLDDAHAACQVAMKKNGNCVEAYKAVVKSDEKGINITDVAKMIETAIEEKRLSLVYQPIVSLKGETEEIYDVYLRMADTEGKLVPAGPLFRAADQANLSIHLDKWVLKEAVSVLRLRRQTKHQTRFFIKLSDQAVKDESLLLYIGKLLKATQLPGNLLTIEISESIAISQIAHAKTFISNLQKMRCKTALEHFGTGLNSETTLTHLPVDYVKIDSSYAKGLSTNTENQNNVKGLVDLAHKYKKQTIAEAVEDANSLTVLWQCEADYAQGIYIQEPNEELEYDFAEE
ncbi:MAG: EAL domain-containing protein [Gammaproteobacteria bacterium]|nr:EAL domain-containing protein [Gammaproteobacteria bacterium]